MQRYITTDAVTLCHGILELTPEQAAGRRHLLTDLGDGLYGIASAVQFKAGETVGYDGDVNKALMECLSVADGDAHLRIDAAAEAAKSELLNAISAAASLAELTDMVTKDEADADILSAMATRVKELRLDAIATAATLGDLDALIPENEDDADILAAADRRADELDNA